MWVASLMGLFLSHVLDAGFEEGAKYGLVFLEEAVADLHVRGFVHCEDEG